jgi:hypothetical protein
MRAWLGAMRNQGRNGQAGEKLPPASDFLRMLEAYAAEHRSKAAQTTALKDAADAQRRLIQ